MTGSDMNTEIPLKSSRVLQLAEREAESLLCLCNLQGGLDSSIHGGTMQQLHQHPLVDSVGG